MAVNKPRQRKYFASLRSKRKIFPCLGRYGYGDSEYMRMTLTVLFGITLTACGSFTTVGSSDQKVASNLKRQNTHCENIPRVYSGVAYNFCYLHSNPGGTYIDWFLGFYVIDSVASGVVDTALLPYTGYKQYKHGNLSIE